jgi:hypothetical protein
MCARMKSGKTPVVVCTAKERQGRGEDTLKVNRMGNASRSAQTKVGD